MIVAEGLKLSGAGLLAGLLCALATGRAMASFLYGVSATDPITYAAVAVVLLAATAAASFVPARRASRVPPMTALRSS
jgi:putative ABC transport system permease protein